MEQVITERDVISKLRKEFRMVERMVKDKEHTLLTEEGKIHSGGRFCSRKSDTAVNAHSNNYYVEQNGNNAKRIKCAVANGSVIHVFEQQSADGNNAKHGH